MKGYTKKTVGNNTYLYKIEPYRDEKGRAKSRQRTVGKVDPDTGRVTYYDWFLEELEASGEPMPEDSVSLPPSVMRRKRELEILQSMKSAGAAWVLTQAGRQSGLLDVLEAVFPDTWRKLFETACFLLESRDTLDCYADWAEQRVMMPGTLLDGAEIDAMLRRISPSDADTFFDEWSRRMDSGTDIAFDVTQQSSYRLLTGSALRAAEDGLLQMNLCMLTDEAGCMPLAEKPYAAIGGDLGALFGTLTALRRMIGEGHMRIVLDGDEYTDANVIRLLDQSMDFLVPVPMSVPFARAQIDEVRGDIDTYDNLLDTWPQNLYGVHRVQKFEGAKKKAHILVIHNPDLETAALRALHRQAACAQRELEKAPEDLYARAEAERYFVVRKSSRHPKHLSFSIRKEKLHDLTQYAGWLVLVTGRMYDAAAGLEIYQWKDELGRGLQRIRDAFESETAAGFYDYPSGRFLAGFIAQILYAILDGRLRRAGADRDFTVARLLRSMALIRESSSDDGTIRMSLTPKQSDLLRQLEIPVPGIE